REVGFVALANIAEFFYLFWSPLMTNHRAILKAIPAVLLVCASASGFAAPETQQLNVTAVVSGVCKFTSAIQTLDFGTLDPSAAVNTPGAGAAVTYKCTKGTAPATFTADLGVNAAGAQRNMKNGANPDLIAYSLTLTNAG